MEPCGWLPLLKPQTFKLEAWHQTGGFIALTYASPLAPGHCRTMQDYFKQVELV
jgi:hypothetical protein